MTTSPSNAAPIVAPTKVDIGIMELVLSEAPGVSVSFVVLSLLVVGVAFVVSGAIVFTDGFEVVPFPGELAKT